MKKMLAIYSNGVSVCVTLMNSGEGLKRIIDDLKRRKITTTIEVYRIEDMYEIDIFKGQKGRNENEISRQQEKNSERNNSKDI